MVTSIIILSIIGLVSATLLYVISRKFHVEEDPRIDEIEAVLSGANCGGSNEHYDGVARECAE